MNLFEKKYIKQTVQSSNGTKVWDIFVKLHLFSWVPLVMMTVTHIHYTSVSYDQLHILTPKIRNRQDSELPMSAMVTWNWHGNPPQPGGAIIILTSVSPTRWRIFIRSLATWSTYWQSLKPVPTGTHWLHKPNNTGECDTHPVDVDLLGDFYSLLTQDITVHPINNSIVFKVV